MIDIQKLKQFHLGFKVLEQFAEKKYGTTLALYLEKLTNEDAVCFLDEQGVYLDTSFYPHKKQFSFEVGCISTNEWYCHPSFYETRNEVSSNGIIKAFELLETKLKTN